jgi:Flp pilus assembly protein TadG
MRRNILSRRRGVAIVYVVCIMAVMLGFCSLAVDFGRVQTAKTELRRAADAAARAAVVSYATTGNSTTAANAGSTMAANDKVDGQTANIPTSNIEIGTWDKTKGSSSAFTSGTPNPNNTTTYTAVQVTASQTVPLLFGIIIGKSSCTVHATSTAALVAVSAPATSYVSAHGNPWLAGEPTGTLASVPDDNYTNNGSSKDHPWKYDIANPSKVATSSTVYTDGSKVSSTDYSSGEPWGSPSVVNVTAGTILQVSVPQDSNNQATNSGFLSGGSVSYYADGSNNGSYAIYSNDAANPSLNQGSVTTSGSELGISNIAAPLNSMLGVFTDGGVPSTEGAAPAGKDFSTQTERDYASIEPQLRQMIYVGTGQTSNGQQQTIIVPNGATKLYLGTMDGHEWSNNQGGYNATITQFNIELVQ